MFTNQIKIMLYVTNVEESSRFWQKIGFVEKERDAVDGTLVVEVSPGEDADTSIVLYDLEFIQKHSPEVAGNTPSLMFFSDDIVNLYKKMKDAGVRVGEMVQLPTGLVFNFADNDENYFAVSGQ
ncbi:VOC family protein [Enterococcus sp. DIV0242_7C1]|uniref:Glyoxalase n=1 Tax=Candidatus Enterococcus dunnyi TaxID=1834192 RepID=A0A200JCE3_9ENTE|nr:MULTISPECIES: VOC family protein [unclassified Enterococcus]MBO0472010.1 VOC family protein [Enterococcus sp. DIV0242_7C1]MCA5011659.1 VOC family protein [Enterococcus sp. S23]MCA5014899.1 VOC family protein [Enterococcus sp. S22(2020)]OUZ34896.1 glyoxalase [Enterococcus sp. 9D6_DIV0238]